MPTVPSLGPGGQGIVPAVSETPGVCPYAGLSAPLLLVWDTAGAGQWGSLRPGVNCPTVDVISDSNTHTPPRSSA